MIDLFALMDPFDPCTKIENMQSGAIQGHKDSKTYNKVSSFTSNENMNNMNPMKTDCSSMFDIGSLLNPMHPTLWMEGTQTLPPQKPATSSNNNFSVGLGRVNQLYHSLIVSAFRSKYRGLKAEELPAVDSKSKGKVIVGGGSGFVGNEVTIKL